MTTDAQHMPCNCHECTQARYRTSMQFQMDQTMGARAGVPSLHAATTEWGATTQRDELKPCPFCGTKAISQGRLADDSTEQQWRIQCGNPFCLMVCTTNTFASFDDAVKAWETRSAPVGDCDCPCEVCGIGTGKHCGNPPCDQEGSPFQ